MTAESAPRFSAFFPQPPAAGTPHLPPGLNVSLTLADQSLRTRRPCPASP